jgi:hypothetical protein
MTRMSVMSSFKLLTSLIALSVVVGAVVLPSVPRRTQTRSYTSSSTVVVLSDDVSSVSTTASLSTSKHHEEPFSAIDISGTNQCLFTQCN